MHMTFYFFYVDSASKTDYNLRPIHLNVKSVVTGHYLVRIPLQTAKGRISPVEMGLIHHYILESASKIHAGSATDFSHRKIGCAHTLKWILPGIRGYQPNCDPRVSGTVLYKSQEAQGVFVVMV